mmetsp:Transcript_17568/g.38138  ORF Transcript_17568/g.38138 Transcript_17568/m.38138 type:complete len:213 (+) Transcript_17568:201-839(+)
MSMDETLVGNDPTTATRLRDLISHVSTCPSPPPVTTTWFFGSHLIVFTGKLILPVRWHRNENEDSTSVSVSGSPCSVLPDITATRPSVLPAINAGFLSELDASFSCSGSHWTHRIWYSLSKWFLVVDRLRAARSPSIRISSCVIDRSEHATRARRAFPTGSLIANPFAGSVALQTQHELGSHRSSHRHALASHPILSGARAPCIYSIHRAPL